jgi:hypothetical protein
MCHTLRVDKAVEHGQNQYIYKRVVCNNNNNTLLAQAMASCHNNTIQSWGRVHTKIEGEVEVHTHLYIHTYITRWHTDCSEVQRLYRYIYLILIC